MVAPILIDILNIKAAFCIPVLTHWGQDKMAAVSQATFQMHFLEWKCWNFDYDFNEVCSYGSNKQYSSNGSDNGLAPARRQGIIWTNDG